MEKIIHPVSGENGYFATDDEKKMIDVAIRLLASHNQKLIPHSHSCGVVE